MLDLSTLFRYSGLPNMAKLELVACSTPRSSQGQARGLLAGVGLECTGLACCRLNGHIGCAD